MTGEFIGLIESANQYTVQCALRVHFLMNLGIDRYTYTP